MAGARRARQQRTRCAPPLRCRAGLPLQPCRKFTRGCRAPPLARQLAASCVACPLGETSTPGSSSLAACRPSLDVLALTSDVSAGPCKRVNVAVPDLSYLEGDYDIVEGLLMSDSPVYKRTSYVMPRHNALGQCLMCTLT